MGRKPKDQPTTIDPQPELNTYEKAIVLFKEDGAYGFAEIDIPTKVLIDEGKLIYKSNPDIFAIFVGHLTKKAREIFKI